MMMMMGLVVLVVMAVTKMPELVFIAVTVMKRIELTVLVKMPVVIVVSAVIIASVVVATVV